MKRPSRVWTSYWFGLLLAGLYPPVFLMSRNWFMYKPVQLCVLLVVTLLAAFVFGAISHFAVAALLRMAGRFRSLRFLTDRREAIQHGFDGMFISSWIIALLANAIFASFKVVVFLALGTLVIVGCAIFLLCYITGRQVLNIMLSVLVAMASVSLVFSFMGAASLDQQKWYEATSREFADVQLSRKPNVYAIVMESYQSPEAMREIYGFENADFIAELERRGFYVHDAFANYRNTITSVGSTLTMSHHYYIPALGNDDAIGLRDIIGGRVHNPVLDTFRRNGYRTQYICESDYMFRRGSMLDYAYPAAQIADVIAIYQIDILIWLVEQTRTTWTVGPNESQTVAFWEVVRQRISLAADSPEPYFTLIKPPATHHTPVTLEWSDLEYWEEAYPKEVEKHNPRFLELVDSIIEADPQAVILMLGDHGAWRYRGLANHDVRTDLSIVLQREGINEHILALDLFGVFQGIRHPGGDPAQLATPSNVNLFRRLFAALADDAGIADLPDETFFQRRGDLYVVVRDGRPLERWELATIDGE